MILDLSPGSAAEQLCDLGKCLNPSDPSLHSFSVRICNTTSQNMKLGGLDEGTQEKCSPRIQAKSKPSIN